jgi:hypothetical protein
LAGSDGQHSITMAHADGEGVCLQVVDLKFQMLILNQNCSSTNWEKNESSRWQPP